MYTLRDIEMLNIFDHLRPYKQRIKEVFDHEGTAATGRFIFRMYKVKLRGYEIRRFLGVEKKHNISHEAHLMAWNVAGMCGTYAPLGYRPGDDQRMSLIASGLLVGGEKLIIT